MRPAKPIVPIALALLAAGCTEQGELLTSLAELPLLASSSEGSVVIPVPEDGVFCFDGEWSPPLGTEDPMTWPSGWGNVAILFPEDGATPPRDVLRLKGEPAQTQAHFGSDGPIVLRYGRAPYQGYGHARFTWFFNAARGGVRVMASINGKVQDSRGDWYHLSCKDINEDMANDRYVVSTMNLSPMR